MRCCVTVYRLQGWRAALNLSSETVNKDARALQWRIDDTILTRGCLDTTREVIAVLRNVLGLKERANNFVRDTPLLGAIPELDSMAVASVLTSLEERFDFMIADDEIDGATFATLGTLVDFVDSKCAS